jgi:hypothetical protein
MEPALVALCQPGYVPVYEDVAAIPVDEAFSDQVGEMHRPPEPTPVAGGRSEAKEVGNGAGSEHRGPVAAHRRIVGGVAGGRGGDEAGPDEWSR